MEEDRQDRRQGRVSRVKERQAGVWVCKKEDLKTERNVGRWANRQEGKEKNKVVRSRYSLDGRETGWK